MMEEQSKIKCQYNKCPLVAEWEMMTVGREKFIYCEIHKEQLKRLGIVVSEMRLPREAKGVEKS